MDIGGKDVTAVNGDIVIYVGSTTLTDDGTEFVFDGSKWYKFGDAHLNDLGSLAY